MEVQLSTFSPTEVCFGRSVTVVLFPMKKGFHMQSLGSLKLIVFVFPVSLMACRGLAISCVTQNLKTMQRLQVGLFFFSSTSPGALCRISSSVAGLIPGERTSATPRSVLQISDRHLGRYPLHVAAGTACFTSCVESTRAPDGCLTSWRRGAVLAEVDKAVGRENCLSSTSDAKNLANSTEETILGQCSLSHLRPYSAQRSASCAGSLETNWPMDWILSNSRS